MRDIIGLLSLQSGSPLPAAGGIAQAVMFPSPDAAKRTGGLVFHARLVGDKINSRLMIPALEAQASLMKNR